MSEIYTVVLLVEQALSDADAVQVRSLHQELVEEQEEVGQFLSSRTWSLLVDEQVLLG